ncbi:MAG: TIGR04326 family surface carbohydrate biosynthesis protein [Ilumatobacteraceae bacterium]
MTQSANSILATPTNHVVIWDQTGEPSLIGDTTIHWNEFFSPCRQSDKISLPQYVEDHGDDLRQRFLAFVRQIGESQVANKSLIEHLQIAPGFSYWWMTLFACKRWSATSNIIEATRLLALEDILREIRPTTISLATDRTAVGHVIRDWCARSGIDFTLLSSKPATSVSNNRKSILVPRPLVALLVLLREMYRRIGSPKNPTSPDNSVDVVAIDYLSRFDLDKALHGEFRSGFWGELVNCLNNAAQTTVFLHNFAPSKATPTRRSVRPLLNALNRNTTKTRHHLLDSRLSVAVLIRGCYIYFRLLTSRIRIRRIKHSFSPSGSQLDLWYLFRDEWLDSLSGSTAMLHSLTIGELEQVVNTTPPCRIVLYLMENQPWEMAFIQLWKNHRSEPLIGIPHSTIRYWDLRYFLDRQPIHSDLISSPPIPNTIAVNGPAELHELRISGMPLEQIVEVEALAYLYLQDVHTSTSESNRVNESTRLLVLGDFFTNQNAALLLMLEQALSAIDRRFVITVKPHPLRPINRGDYPRIQFVIDTSPLVEQLGRCDIVLTTNGTSASAEAYQCGLSVITALNGETFNYSPLRDVLGATFVESPEHLAQALTQSTSKEFSNRTDYYRIDNSLSRWKQLLSI